MNYGKNNQLSITSSKQQKSNSKAVHAFKKKRCSCRLLSHRKLHFRAVWILCFYLLGKFSILTIAFLLCPLFYVKQRVDLNIYSSNSSSTSSNVLCNSTLCTAQSQCSSALSSCPYKVIYLSNGTSSSGILVEDVLHLITDDDQTKATDAQITFGWVPSVFSLGILELLHVLSSQLAFTLEA